MQLSLAELFFVTTVSAIAIGVFIYVSKIAALLGGGTLAVIAVVRFTGCRNLIFGGLVGFLASTIAAWLVIAIGETDLAASIGLALLCPATGYIVGAFVAEISNDDRL